ncbi:MAG: insulinase family protein [Saprospiraceae bacterium]|nr:insulinase family protein [Candidatus Brachybacter algidus]
MEDLKKFHTDFYGATDATASVVGDFSKEEIENDDGNIRYMES